MTDEIQGDMPMSEDTETSEDSSTEETDAVEEITEEESQDDSTDLKSSAEEEEPKVPLSRLRRETEKRRELESQLKETIEKVEKLSQSQTVTGDKEQEAKNYLKNLIKEQYDELKQAEKKEQEIQDKVFKESLGEIKEYFPEISSSEKKFLDFFEKGAFEDTPDGMWGAARLFVEVQKTKTTSSPKRPKLPTGKKTTDKIVETIKEDKNRSLHDIVRAVKDEYNMGNK